MNIPWRERCAAEVPVSIFAAGCSRSANPQAYPLSHWVTGDPRCVRQTAQAIIDSRRPWRNDMRHEQWHLKRTC